MGALAFVIATVALVIAAVNFVLVVRDGREIARLRRGPWRADRIDPVPVEYGGGRLVRRQLLSVHGWGQKIDPWRADR